MNISVSHDTPLSLGIDIGTTSLSLQIVSSFDGTVVYTDSVVHNAALPERPPINGAFAADAQKLTDMALSLIDTAVRQFPNIRSIGFTGQMHGIVCLGKNTEILSPLYTWQNQFGQLPIPSTDETVCDKIRRLTVLSVPTGYGLVTVTALREFGLFPSDTVKVTGIAELAAMRLTGTSEAVIHPTNAASLGFYDIADRRFIPAALDRISLPSVLLPTVCDDYTVIGYYRNIPVVAAIGDNQASVYGSVTADDRVALCNIGTGGQISFLCDSPEHTPDNCSYEIRPYIGGKWLYVGSVLCGGRSYAILADFVGDIASRLGCDIPRSRIYDILNHAATESADTDRLHISTRFSGTRSAPTERGYIRNIGTDNFTLPMLSYGILYGTVEELYSLYRQMTDVMPDKLVVSGNAMRRNPMLRQMTAELFGCPVVLPQHTEEAAFGAAKYAAVATRAWGKLF